MVYIGEIDPALLSPNLALFLSYASSFTDISAIFVEDLEKFQITSSSDFRSNTPRWVHLHRMYV